MKFETLKIIILAFCAVQLAIVAFGIANWATRHPIPNWRHWLGLNVGLTSPLLVVLYEIPFNYSCQTVEFMNLQRMGMHLVFGLGLFGFGFNVIAFSETRRKNNARI